MSDNPWHAVAVAVFLWWFFTGAILWRVRVADNGGPDQHLLSVLVAAPVMGLGGWAGLASLSDTSGTGIHLAFASALLLWGWIELAFLSGVITGPNRRICPPQARGAERFWRALGTVAWHEILLVAVMVGMALASVEAENPFAFYTFALLFFARVSAKLNLFFGVPHINTQFLPRPLGHLPSHFRIARIGFFFPLSVSALTVAGALLLERCLNAETRADAAGYALLTSLAFLALVEHWFMVLPVPDEKLWRWMIPAPKSGTPRTKDRLHEDPNGL